MIEIVVLDFLKRTLSVPVFSECPKNPPPEYVLLERTGGAKTNHLPTATFAFQSYAESMYEAAKLNEKVKEAMENMIELDEIRGVSLNSDYNFTDTTTKRYRYQAVFDVKYY